MIYYILPGFLIESQNLGLFLPVWNKLQFITHYKGWRQGPSRQPAKAPIFDHLLKKMTLVWILPVNNSLIQGISLWNVSFKLTLTDRNMQVRFCLKVSVYSWGYGIWVSSTSFQKSNIGWPQQPPTEMVPYISESLDFWWTIPQKMTNTGHFDAIDDQTIGIRKFFEKIRL